MHDVWLGLWAAGLLTRTQRLQLVACNDAPDAAVQRLWEDTRRRPKKWTKFERAEDLLKHAATYYQRLKQACEHAAPRLELVEASAVGVQSRSPYLCYAGKRPPQAGALGVVGTRSITQEEQQRVTQWLYPLIAQCHAVISGGAHGVDTIAHHVALESHVPTWVVFASGLAHVSPKSNRQLFERCLRQGGGWVSEKPPWYTPYPTDFLERNTVIAALSNAILVARAPSRSGALSTARAARSMGKPVFAFPGAPDNPNAEGCHQLLQKGARWMTPSTRLTPFLGLEGQQQIPLNAVEDSMDQTKEWPRVHWNEAEGERLKRFADWWADGQQGWIAQSASAHQEIVLDLELGGWLERNAAGEVEWSDKGRLAEKLLRNEAK